ncbi:nucleotide exchange factor GrpE [Domibacillus mangrovi]|uniref:Uncharacterized protein n=1 Tax=Domibacillus mangrovi TaxID=1714354 RepID=A0A1Q5P279_9BACI|nr:nucleotide exchange factor GrpE [Domibacillus mangrovi]OKL36273.1 hypothetical protein BLL40_10225 [Domibacillus mangrovi]
MKKTNYLNGGLIMGRNDRRMGNNNTGSLAYTSKNLKVKSNTVNEEYARELAELDNLKKKRERTNSTKYRNQ